MNPRFTITYRLNQSIAYIERARGFLEAVQLSEAWMREMSAQAFLLEAHHTRLSAWSPAACNRERLSAKP